MIAKNEFFKEEKDRPFSDQNQDKNMLKSLETTLSKYKKE